MVTPTHAPVHLYAGGVSAVFACDERGLPGVVYWGSGLDPARPGLVDEIAATARPAVLKSAFDAPRSVSIAPTEFQGWLGTPALACHRGGVAASSLVLAGVDLGSFDRKSLGLESSGRAAGAGSPVSGMWATFTLRDTALDLRLVYEYRLGPDGVLSARAEVSNLAVEGAVALDVAALRVLLPVPARASEMLDFTGRWSGERRPQRSALTDGARIRATRRGRPGHDAPHLTLLGTPGFGFERGEVWAAHIAWSGNQEALVERLPEGAGALSTLLGGGELLEPGEIRLVPGASYAGPTLLFAYSAEGIDGIARRYHQHVRALPAHPASLRPLVLNTWEAVYFDHDLDRLTELAEQAAEIGVERFVLDDGWFLGRRDDTTGLGDWFVDTGVWPRGLTEISARVHALGMQFGLWFEPEMVNLDSDLARAHPQWLLSGTGAAELSWRNQFVLNVANSEAWQYLYTCIDDVVSRYGVDFIKWDHNRDLQGAIDRSTGAFGVHEQTLAVYRLMDALRAKHPSLEIESCASGGGRVDLGVLAHAQRVWASDTNDPVERQMVQLWTGLLLPPELVGAHVGPAQAHTTQRVTSLSFRLATALFGHAGIEWDITGCSADERAALVAWAALYKELRPLLHAGVSVHADDIDEGASLSGVVSEDRGHAIFFWVRTQTSGTAHTPRVRIPGLRAEAVYEVRVRDEIGAASRHEVADPSWFPASGQRVTLSGEVLTTAGVPLPLLDPGNALLLEFTAVTA